MPVSPVLLPDTKTTHLCAVVAILTLALARFGQPALQSGYRPVQDAEDWPALTAKDPASGSSMAASLGALGIKAEASGILVFLSDCEACSLSKLPQIAKTAGSAGAWVVWPHAPSASTARALKAQYPDLRFVVGPMAQVDWNVTFYPRVYAVGAKGELQFAQHPSASVFQALTEAKARLGGDRG